MKHTMKKLLCMALAIMLLVSAVPVFAAADDNWVDVVYARDGSGVTGYVRCSINPETNKMYEEDIARVASAISGLNPRIIGWEYQGASFSSLRDIQFATKGVNVEPVFETVSYYTFQVNYANGTATKSFTVADGTNVTTDMLPSNPTSKGCQFDGWYLNNTDKVEAGSTVNGAWDGKVVTARWTVIGCTECGMTGGEHTTSCSQYQGNGSSQPSQPSQPSGSTTASYVSVILSTKTSGFVAGDYINCNLVSGKITPTDRNTVAAAISSKGLNIVGWKRADNGQQASSLVDFDFAGLAEPINILPIFGASNNGNGNGNTVTTPTTGKLSLVIRVNGTKKYDNDVKNFTNATVANVIKNIYDSDWTSKYAFDKVEVNGVTYGRSDLEVRAGDDVDIYLTRKYSKDNSNKVYLHVYLNGDASTIAMTKDITGTYLMDDWKTDTTEILKYLKNNYYTAKDSSNAITIDGLYVSTDTKGAFPSNYYADNKTTSKDNINDLLEDGYVHISVMLKNAKAKSSSTADSSNPKTGDTIFVPVMVMGVTATALAAAYVFGKKRFAR